MLRKKKNRKKNRMDTGLPKVGLCYDDWSGIPLALGNDLGVESGFVESPFYIFFCKRRVHCLLEPHRLRTQFSQGCNEERLTRETMGPTAQSSPPR